jgi:hypothetical protein
LAKNLLPTYRFQKIWIFLLVLIRLVLVGVQTPGETLPARHEFLEYFIDGLIVFEDVEDTQCGCFDVIIPTSLEKFFEFLVLLWFFADLVLKFGQPPFYTIAYNKSF